ncbi:MAG: noncanonical pyrimidine nucleotidase, YjjG family [Clostridia bacterium]|nr:noncanonical pyrimidine nucleotidase, YjjG family [Clostridia bacterium]
MKLDNIKAIFFDADDTIVNHKQCEKDALLYLFDKIGKNYKEQYQDIFRPLDRKLWDSVAHNLNPVPKSDIPEYRFKEFFKQINLNYDDYKKANEFFQDGLANSVALIENAYDIIKYLYNKDYKLYVVTNGLVKLQKPRITNSKISKYISDIIVSEEVNSSKPNPKIFNVLLDKINLKPNEVIMIGDSLEKDIKGAGNANIKAIWYNHNNKINNTEIKPYCQITNLIELKNIL